MTVVHTTPGARIGIDVGGTFTDFVLFDANTARFAFHKQPSTPSDPALAVQLGLTALLEKCALRAQDVDALLHGTTIGLNAIIQRRGARVGLVVTEGFRDILEIGRARMPSSFDFHATREAPFLTRDRVIEMPARFNRDGQRTQWPDAAALDEVAEAIAALDVDATVVMLINGYAAPDEEGALTDSLQTRIPDVKLLSAARTWPEIREYERTLVATLNAYIQPLMARYFTRLTALMTEIGLDAPILVTASNGGSLSLQSALERPIDTVLSGPAGGVVAAARLSRETGMPQLVTFDMGGTSSDIAVCVDGQAEIATRTEIGGLPLVLPVVGVSAIGAGGGSVVWVDEQGVIKVGPLSAGANPGPAAYARGGEDATVTDCYLATGVLDAKAFLGGDMPLDASLADAALQRVATALDMTGDDIAARAASGALAVTTAQMASELRKSLAQRGLDPSGFALVPFGGAGPTHANWLAEDAGLSHIVVPAIPGTFCALGAVSADLRRDFVRSLRVPLNAAAAQTLDALWQEMETGARAWLDEQGIEQTGPASLLAAIDMRYAGQAYEIKVKLPHPLPRPLTPEIIAEAFHREHERLYGFRDGDAPIDLSTIRLAIVGATASLPTHHVPDGGGRPTPEAHRPVFLRGAWHQAAVYRRAALRAGDVFDGPAVVAQADTTVLVLSGWQARTDTLGYLHLTRQGATA
ncbi:hydantoinase/oxoprolinase family protein [Robbsia sp. KACC 23696]|uniref:hydantoinase/oxoprolinase family protein n=1 Tax=Robbsia sp. KACC 23696 TaxID=3149231 RepID=UPI00325A7427